MEKCNNCNQEIDFDTKKCNNCGTDLIKENESIIENTKDEGNKKELSGIGGWLILFAIGIIITPFSCLIGVLVYFYLFYDGIYGLLINKSSEIYMKGFLEISIFEILGSFTFMIFSIILLFLFFSKHKLFSKYYKIFAISFIVYNLIDYGISELIPGISGIEGESNGFADTIKSINGTILWLAYVYKSQRVKNTFVEEKIKSGKTFGIIVSTIIGLIIIGAILLTDYSRLNMTDEEYGEEYCYYIYGENSYYNGIIKDYEFGCSCIDGYKLDLEEETCIKD